MPIPDDFILDIHDFAAIVLDTHARIDPPFRTSKLVEVATGTGRIRTYEQANLAIPPEWQSAQDKPRVAYIHDRNRASESQDATTTVDTLASPGKLLTPGDRALRRRDLEDAFWRCKTLNNGSFLGDTAHRVLSSLPRTARLRVRTSQGYELTCAAHEVRVLLNKVSPHESCFVSEGAQHWVGFGKRLSWPVLLLGGGAAEHTVVLDLAIAQVGGRGLGDELFALESVEEYRVELLPKYAVSAECDGKLYIFNPSVMTMEQRERQGALVPKIMDRLAKIANGQDYFCRHCGKDNVNLRCSRCEKACFCLACLDVGWKYHEIWCS